MNEMQSTITELQHSMEVHKLRTELKFANDLRTSEARAIEKNKGTVDVASFMSQMNSFQSSVAKPILATMQTILSRPAPAAEQEAKQEHAVREWDVHDTCAFLRHTVRLSETSVQLFESNQVTGMDLTCLSDDELQTVFKIPSFKVKSLKKRLDKI